ncbi:MAG TPA: RluA family pseudouridine synthase [Pyrinomonadaceae bacterium]|jgi:23S rRNA pseudouridine1911/1915/1917 synthase
MKKRTIKFQVGEESEGLRLDQFLASRVRWLSRMRIASVLEEGVCEVNGEAARAGRKVSAGDAVEVSIDEDAPATAMTPEPLPLEIVYEGEEFLVLVKHAGVLVHPTRAVKTGTLANALAFHLNRERLSEIAAEDVGAVGACAEHSNSQDATLNACTVRPGIVHRLDRATSGLMVVAKGQRALSILSAHFHRRLVEKRYTALVHGCVAEDEMVADAPIGRDPGAKPQWGVMDSGKHALTRLRVLRRGAGMSLVELEPVTGRTNQLRIHCAHFGHPIVGDSWYGSDFNTRLCLHASRLAFHHPTGGGWLEFESALPAEISEVMRGHF